MSRCASDHSGPYSFQHSVCSQLTQSSGTRPDTRSNSRVLFVTRMASTAIACPAMALSSGPIGVPARRHLNLCGDIHRGAVPGLDDIETGAERVNQLNVMRRGLRAGGGEAHFCVDNGRDHDAVMRSKLFCKPKNE